MKSLTIFADTIVPNVSPLAGNSIESEETVSFGIVSGTTIGSRIDAVDWTDSIIEHCRFEGSTIENSSFDRVALCDSDLSGVTFSNCLLRDCVVLGSKAQFHLALHNCILDNVLIARSRTDRVDIHHCRIGALRFLGMESTGLNFHQCQAYKRTGRVALEDCELERVGGLEQLHQQAIAVELDTTLWRELGDRYLTQSGMRQAEAISAPVYHSIDELLDKVKLKA